MYFKSRKKIPLFPSVILKVISERQLILWEKSHNIDKSSTGFYSAGQHLYRIGPVFGKDVGENANTLNV